MVGCFSMATLGFVQGVLAIRLATRVTVRVTARMLSFGLGFGLGFRLKEKDSTASSL